MKQLFILALISMSVALTSCTDNEMARQFGGTEVVELEPGQKFVNATWKEVSLWVITEPMDSSDVPRTITFKEKSSYGMIEGTIIFKENK